MGSSLRPSRHPLARFLTRNGLSLAFLALFAAALVGQSVAGWMDENEQLAEHARAAVGYLDYITSSAFIVDVAENWQSEFLQFFLFIFATIWLVQKGSPESDPPGHEGVGTDAEESAGDHARPGSPAWAAAGGIRGWLYSNSLLTAMGAFFLLSWLAQSLAGTVVAGDEATQHGVPAPSWLQYIASAEFWSRTLQNWQSEFLAVGAMVVLSIFLRQRGSSESKPLGAPHGRTGG